MSTEGEIKQELVQKVLEEAIEGKSTRQIGQALGLSHTFIQKVMRREEYVNEAKRAIKRRLAQNVGLIADKLTKLIKEGNLQAMTLNLKVIGSLAEEPPATTANQAITVVLPGARVEKVIETEGKDYHHGDDSL